ncbi:sensor domain-containing diguanylate cyclase [Pseudoduganella lutea]|uniref:diguanylate cyclase n=1 Tax=Pseudoduganella lutea TaxID=321985 RepID=A0A4P6L773_9BURK|nr:diguanylate cyclase [Pseudoduganella lutea]QBE66818.1 GGDEF domain-containing protein [Pseudoduganella lutea]
MPAEARARSIAIIAVVVSILVAAIPFFINSRVSEGVPQLKLAADRQTAYTDLLGMLRDVESGQRGFALSGLDVFLEPYTAAVLEIPSLKRELMKGALDAQERDAIRQITELTDAKLANAADSIAARKNFGAAPDSLYASTALGKAQMDKLRGLIGKQITLMAERRDRARKTLIDGSAQVAYFSAFAGLFNALLLGTAAFNVRRLFRDRAHAADQLKEAIALAETRNAMMSGSARLLQALDSIRTLDDTSAVLTPCLTALLPNVSGTVYLYRDANDVLEPLASWGADAARSAIASEDCWALRFGRAHDHHVETDLCCHHLQGDPHRHHLCIPMVTQGAVLGLMSVKVDQLPDRNFALHRELVTVLAEQVSLALSNVRLREALREQSIIDPLTDLYNRRFLEESLKRELARSVRNRAPLSVIMFDVDHFKRLNDTFGHDAGDVVLKAVAAATKAAVRKADIVCRYGGEEMIVVLPDCAQGMAMERAEMIRRAIESVRIEHGGREIPQVTASFGVASHPNFGLDGDALVRAADAALYVAKRRGRNNVQMAA